MSRVAVALITTILLAACGSAEERAADEPIAQPTATATPAVAPDAEPSSTAESTSAASDARHVTEVLETSPADGGWLLPAGTWVAPDFAAPMEFTTDRDLIIERAVEGAVWLRDPADEVGRTWLIIADLGFVQGGENGAAERPVPQTPDAITEEITTNPMSELIEIGALGEGDDATTWWEWTHVDPTGRTSYGCRDGRCISPASTTSGERLAAVIGAPTRTYQVVDPALTLGVWVTGAAGGYDALVPAAEALVPTIRAITDAPPAAEVSWWPLAGRTENALPVGSYRALVGTTFIEGVLTDPVDGVLLTHVHPDVLGFESPSGFYGFLEPTGLATPDLAVALGESTPLTGDELADVDLTDPAAVERWLEGIVDIESVTQTTVAGLEGTAYEVGVRALTTLCAGGCGPVKMLRVGPWVQFPFWTNQIIAVPEANLLVHLEARPGHTIEQLLDEMAPILDGLTITPVD